MKNKNTKNINKRLEEIRKAIQNESVSTSELLELESLQEYIDPNDVELLEWAGVEEFPMVYRVYYNRTEEYYIDIEAKSEMEAMEKWEQSELALDNFNITTE